MASENLKVANDVNCKSMASNVRYLDPNEVRSFLGGLAKKAVNMGVSFRSMVAITLERLRDKSWKTNTEVLNNQRYGNLTAFYDSLKHRIKFEF